MQWPNRRKRASTSRPASSRSVRCGAFMYRPDRTIGLLTGGGGHLLAVDPATLADIGLEVMDSTASLPLRLPRQRQVVVSESVLQDPATADQLASMALDGLQVIRLADYYERRQRRGAPPPGGGAVVFFFQPPCPPPPAARVLAQTE